MFPPCLNSFQLIALLLRGVVFNHDHTCPCKMLAMMVLRRSPSSNQLSANAELRLPTHRRHEGSGRPPPMPSWCCEMHTEETNAKVVHGKVELVLLFLVNKPYQRNPCTFCLWAALLRATCSSEKSKTLATSSYPKETRHDDLRATSRLDKGRQQ